MDEKCKKRISAIIRTDNEDTIEKLTLYAPKQIVVI
jgi:hypothetical protein